ncbi:hypothetical protein NIES39_O01480 [Arthrospira platensis NIES-39]|nr:hypothetical protein NIES39_O01480 [Arthrospira platensis NIES-39]
MEVMITIKDWRLAENYVGIDSHPGNCLQLKSCLGGIGLVPVDDSSGFAIALLVSLTGDYQLDP